MIPTLFRRTAVRAVGNEEETASEWTFLIFFLPTCVKLVVYLCAVIVSAVLARFPDEGGKKKKEATANDQTSARLMRDSERWLLPARPSCSAGKLVVSTAIRTAANIAHCDGKRPGRSIAAATTTAEWTEKADDDVIRRAGRHSGACDVDHNHHNVLSSACVFVGAMRNDDHGDASSGLLGREGFFRSLASCLL